MTIRELFQRLHGYGPDAVVKIRTYYGYSEGTRNDFDLAEISDENGVVILEPDA